MECVTALQHMQPLVPVTLSVDAIGDRLIVTASGEFDLESGRILQQTLSDALDHAVGGLELDLAGVEFCDCSALNVLLRVRHRALQASKSFILCAISPAVARLLALTGTLPLFTAGEEAYSTRRPRNGCHGAKSSGDDQAAENTHSKCA
ncbi:STAS domain-containing protein [Streptomyces javensis]|uniref:STAS domain-containing protein n=1 Tax=Streptomyces javensis TaxID=114698 RepID=UPI0033EE91BB